MLKTSLPSAAGADTPDVQADAIDAYIYGYPLVVTEMTRRVLTNVQVAGARSAPMGQFAHYRSFPNPTTQDIAGSNVDTLYSIAWLDLSSGPYILHLPDEAERFYLMPILDAWSEVIASRVRVQPAIGLVISLSQDLNGQRLCQQAYMKSNQRRTCCGSRVEPTPPEHWRTMPLFTQFRINIP